MSKKRIIETFLFIFVSFVFSEAAFSWEADPTHKDLTDYASENSVLHKDKGDYLKHLGFENGFEEYFKWNKRRTVKEWLQEGSALEDEWWGWGDTLTGFRCRNHFHNPLKNKDGGPWGEWDSAGLDDFFSGIPALLWAQDRTKQSAYPEGDWTWQEARDRYYLALTSQTDSERQENFARTFRALGHQMHFVQDMAVPAHVRNDAHPLRFNKAGGLHIEKWAAKKENRPTVNSYATPPESPSLDLNKDITYKGEKLVPITQFTDIDEYDGSNPSTSLSIGLAEYTNANFFSDDTIFTEDYPINDRHHFPYPRKSDTNVQSLIDQKLLPETNTVTGDAEFHISRVDDEGHSIINYFVQPTYHTNDMAESGTYYRSFYLSENCHNDYSEHLIPRAVGYSAGLLDYFFRGELKVEPVEGGLKIINKCEDAMQDGDFELYYDDENGIRKSVTITSGSEVTSLAKDCDQTIEFAEQSDAKSYIVVYQGGLGNEEYAVIGKVLCFSGTKPYVIVAAATIPVEHNTVVEEVLYIVWDVLEEKVIFGPGTNEELAELGLHSEMRTLYQTSGLPTAGNVSFRILERAVDGEGNVVISKKEIMPANRTNNEYMTSPSYALFAMHLQCPDGFARHGGGFHQHDDWHQHFFGPDRICGYGVRFANEAYEVCRAGERVIGNQETGESVYRIVERDGSWSEDFNYDDYGYSCTNEATGAYYTAYHWFWTPDHWETYPAFYISSDYQGNSRYFMGTYMIDADSTALAKGFVYSERDANEVRGYGLLTGSTESFRATTPLGVISSYTATHPNQLKRIFTGTPYPGGYTCELVPSVVNYIGEVDLLMQGQYSQDVITQLYLFQYYPIHTLPEVRDSGGHIVQQGWYETQNRVVEIQASVGYFVDEDGNGIARHIDPFRQEKNEFEAEHHVDKEKIKLNPTFTAAIKDLIDTYYDYVGDEQPHEMHPLNSGVDRLLVKTRVFYRGEGRVDCETCN